MLDGRVLGASQVEYKPFGKPPLKREVQASSDLTNPEQAVILENLVVNGIKTPFGNVVFFYLEGDLDLNHLGNPSKERGSGNVGIPYIELPPQFDSKLLHG